MRNLIPLARVRCVEEAMDMDVFIEELTLSEAGGEDDEPTEPNPGDPENFPPTGDGDASPDGHVDPLTP